MKRQGKQKIRLGGAMTAALAAQILWGLLAVYWKWFGDVSPVQILVHRVVWSVVFLHLLLTFTQGRRYPARLVQDRSHYRASFLGGLLVSINWLFYIWSVHSGRILEASLGYYIMPLMTGLFGYFLGERFTKKQWIAFAFAATGVLVQIASLGAVPVFALIIAVSFSGYTVVKKHSPLRSLDSLYCETLFVTPLALLVIGFSELSGSGITGNLPPLTWLKMMTTGIVTAVPLLLFGYGVRGIPLRVTAFVQYLNPTMALLLGVIVYKEPFTLLRAASFLLIWIGVLIFTLDRLRPSGT